MSTPRGIKGLAGLCVGAVLTSCTPKPALAPTSPVTTRTIPLVTNAYEMPRRRKAAVPLYPATLRTRGLEADVSVLVGVDATGKVTNVKVIKESPYPEFNRAAQVAAEADDFEPARKDGEAVSSSIAFTYRFRLGRK
jgi:TonB family protein